MPNIIIIAGELSADMHGARLAEELKKSIPELRLYGIGGPQLRAAGVETFADLTPYALIGFIEVVRHYPLFKRVFSLALAKIGELSPDAVILIDYPGFNLRLARKIKQLFPKVKIIYYISPQVWAWGKNRIRLIKNTVDKMLVIFEFEKAFYRRYGIDAEFVGHPLLETVRRTRSPEDLLSALGSSRQTMFIGLLPGSRPAEIKRMLPLFLKSAFLLSKQKPGIKFLLFRSPAVPPDLFDRCLESYRTLPVINITSGYYDFLGLCSFAWVCSGTATLETAILEVPMVIVYKTSFFTWCLSRLFIDIPHIGIVNIVAGEKIVPEFVQFRARAKQIAHISAGFLENDRVREEIKVNLRKVKSRLGRPHAAEKAALCIKKAGRLKEFR